MAKADILVKVWVQGELIHIGALGSFAGTLLQRSFNSSGMSAPIDMLKDPEQKEIIRQNMWIMQSYCEFCGLVFENDTSLLPLETERAVSVLERLKAVWMGPENVEKYEEMRDITRLAALEPDFS